MNCTTRSYNLSLLVLRYISGRSPPSSDYEDWLTVQRQVAASVNRSHSPCHLSRFFLDLRLSFPACYASSTTSYLLNCHCDKDTDIVGATVASHPGADLGLGSEALDNSTPPGTSPKVSITPTRRPSPQDGSNSCPRVTDIICARYPQRPGLPPLFPISRAHPPTHPNHRRTPPLPHAQAEYPIYHSNHLQPSRYPRVRDHSRHRTRIRRWLPLTPVSPLHIPGLEHARSQRLFRERGSSGAKEESTKVSSNFCSIRIIVLRN